MASAQKEDPAGDQGMKVNPIRLRKTPWNYFPNGNPVNPFATPPKILKLKAAIELANGRKTCGIPGSESSNQLPPDDKTVPNASASDSGSFAGLKLANPSKTLGHGSASSNQSSQDDETVSNASTSDSESFAGLKLANSIKTLGHRSASSNQSSPDDETVSNASTSPSESGTFAGLKLAISSETYGPGSASSNQSSPDDETVSNASKSPSESGTFAGSKLGTSRKILDCRSVSSHISLNPDDQSVLSASRSATRSETFADLELANSSKTLDPGSTSRNQLSYPDKSASKAQTSGTATFDAIMAHTAAQEETSEELRDQQSEKILFAKPRLDFENVIHIPNAKCSKDIWMQRAACVPKSPSPPRKPVTVTDIPEAACLPKSPPPPPLTVSYRLMKRSWRRSKEVSLSSSSSSSSSNSSPERSRSPQRRPSFAPNLFQPKEEYSDDSSYEDEEELMKLSLKESTLQQVNHCDAQVKPSTSASTSKPKADTVPHRDIEKGDVDYQKTFLNPFGIFRRDDYKFITETQTFNKPEKKELRKNLTLDEMIDDIISRGPPEPSRKCKSSEEEVFRHACVNGLVDTAVQILYEEDINVNDILKSSWTGLQHACYNSQTNIIKVLLKLGADPNFKNRKDNMNALIAAACSPHDEEMGPFQCVKILLNSGVNVNSVQKNGASPLTLAVRRGHEKIARLLLENGANVNHRGDFNRTAINWATHRNNEEMVKLLLEYKANPILKKTGIISLPDSSK